MLLIEAHSVTFSYPEASVPLFESLDFTVDGASRIGLVGTNGSGKTTLIKLILGDLDPESGGIHRAAGLRVGHLPQGTEDPEKCSLREYIGENVEDYLLEKILFSLGMSGDFPDRPFSALSGGEKTKAALARLLLKEPDFLLLDEPTNHLDLRGRLWLEDFLASRGIPFLAVSHDRRFLDRTVSAIWELKDRRIREYAGGYTAYREQKESEYRGKLAAYERSKHTEARLRRAAAERKTIARRMETFKGKRSVKKNGALCSRDVGSGKASLRSGNAMRSATLLESRLQKLLASEEAKRPESPLRREIRMDGCSEGNRRVLMAEDLSAGYGGKPIFSGLGFRLFRGERLAVTGGNGSGKTTLFRILAGEIAPLRGRTLIPPSVSLFYLAQELENLDPDATLLDAVMAGRGEGQTKARHILADFGITGDEVFRRVSSASLGERTKTALAAGIFAEPDLFILDEPTNHLEPESLKAFEGSLQSFPGAVLFASHDREFVEKTATGILDMESYRAKVQ